MAYVAFPAAHQAKLRSTNLLERLNDEIKRRTEVLEGRRVARLSTVRDLLARGIAF